MAAKNNIKKNGNKGIKNKTVSLKKEKAASELKKRTQKPVKKKGPSAPKAKKLVKESPKAVSPKKSKIAAKEGAKPVSVKKIRGKKTKVPAEKKESASVKKQARKKQERKRPEAVPPKNKKSARAVKKEDPAPEKKRLQVKKTRSIGALRKEEAASWKFFEKNGNVQIKIYTESEAIFSKLARINGIQKSAKYFVKGRQVGADFIVPLDMAESACSIAGVKVPKVIIRKPE